jgi:hypothetical protein
MRWFLRSRAALVLLSLGLGTLGSALLTGGPPAALAASPYGQKAMPLPNGQVLVAGGEKIASTGSAILSEAKLYTP